jgi:hypothetical protein
MVYYVTTPPDNDQEFLVVCMHYSNFVDPPKFYLTPYYNRANQMSANVPAPVTALQESKLSADFSCAKLG